MSNINTGRIVLGGLLAGLVLNIGEFVLNDVVLGSQMKEFMTRHNFLDPGQIHRASSWSNFCLGNCLGVGLCDD